MSDDDRDPQHCVGLPLDAFVRAMKGYASANRANRRKSVRDANWRLIAELARDDPAVARTQDERRAMPVERATDAPRTDGVGEDTP
jgi:hypothetical protein